MRDQLSDAFEALLRSEREIYQIEFHGSDGMKVVGFAVALSLLGISLVAGSLWIFAVFNLGAIGVSALLLNSKSLEDAEQPSMLDMRTEPEDSS
jgi:hypothetical protein